MRRRRTELLQIVAPYWAWMLIAVIVIAQCVIVLIDEWLRVT
jgi:hypothetical protein